jgi:DNA-binding beta-propeller fold protein YncE
MKSGCLVLFLCANLALAHARQSAPLRLVKTIPLPNVEGRIDHMAADVKGQRLFVAALGNNTLEVVDLRAGRRVYTLGGLREPQGVAFAPDLNRIFVANGQGEGCDVYDGSTFKLIQNIPLGGDHDNVRYDPASKQIVVGYGNGALAFLDAATGKNLGKLLLRGHPESFQMEKKGRRIFLNVPPSSQIVVVDRRTRALIDIWPINTAQANFPMALDETNHRLFVGCRNPARLLVYDTQTGREIASLPISGDTDDIFYDAARKRLYLSCGAGSLDVIRQTDADHYAVVEKMPTAAGARTSLFVPALDRLFVAIPQRGAQRAEIRVYMPSP